MSQSTYSIEQQTRNMDPSLQRATAFHQHTIQRLKRSHRSVFFQTFFDVLRLFFKHASNASADKVIRYSKLYIQEGN